MRAKCSSACPFCQAVCSLVRASCSVAACRALTSSSAHRARVISARRESTFSPLRKSTASFISSAFPTVRPRTWFMSVIRAEVLVPAPLATLTMERASLRASSMLSIKAPLPHFKSITRYSSPAASFLERIEAVISSIDSTVPQTSRMA